MSFLQAIVIILCFLHCKRGFVCVTINSFWVSHQIQYVCPYLLKYFIGSTKPRVRFSARTKSSSYTEAEDPSDSQTGPLKVPTWPGTLPNVDQSGSPSPKEISSPSSDTALLTAKKISQLPTYAPHEQSRRLHHTTSEELFIRRSNSNDSIKTSTVAPHMFRKSSSFGQLSDSYEVADVNFLSNEVAFVSDRLSKVASTCLSNCWRDFIWYQLLLMDNADEETAARKQRRRAERRESFYEFSLQKWKLEKTLKSIRKITTPVRVLLHPFFTYFFIQPSTVRCFISYLGIWLAL